MKDDASLIQDLKRVKHFRNLNLSDLVSIVRSGRIRTYPKGMVIYQEKDPCAGMFVLLSGRVHLCKVGPQGQMNILSVIQPVIMFNEVAVLDGDANPATAVAVENAITWQVSHASFQALLERIPQVGLSLLKVLARRNREMLNHYEDLSFRPVIARTAKLLLDLSNNGSQVIHRRDCSIEQMAARIATVPEAVSRSLNGIKNSGCIELNRVEIRITSPARLAEMAFLSD
jgi:CRP/FNR family cyclic AMP-dependent transcriptional regulator